MWRETVQLYLEPGTSAVALEAELHRRGQAMPGLLHFNLARNCPGGWGAGDYSLDLCFSGDGFQIGAADGLGRLPGVALVERMACQPIGGGQRAPGLQNGIWRTLLLRVRAQQSPARVAALERDLLRMPAYIAGICNWQLSRVCSDSAWTHVWQQEFASLDDLQGEYLTHPFHWGWVDRWFDPEFPEWTVEAFVHAFCPLAESILTHPLSATRNLKESP